MKKLILASGANSKTSCKFENFKTSKTNCSHSYLNTIEITHCSKLVLTGNQFQSLRELENCISRIIRVWSLFCSIRFKEVCIIFYRFFWETSFLSFCAFAFVEFNSMYNIFSVQSLCEVFISVIHVTKVFIIWKVYFTQSIFIGLSTIIL